jgi:hypothetical protein
MPKSKSKQINLIPQDGFEFTNFGRILKWTISAFRIIVIVTDIIVMSAFFSRFWLDSRNSDLDEEIEINKARISAYKNLESDFLTIQKKIALAKKIYSNNGPTFEISSITDKIPRDIILDRISRSENVITIKAKSYSEQSIAQFIANLSNIKQFSDVNLNQASVSPENNIVTIFVISMKINQT